MSHSGEKINNFNKTLSICQTETLITFSARISTPQRIFLDKLFGVAVGAALFYHLAIGTIVWEESNITSSAFARIPINRLFLY